MGIGEGVDPPVLADPVANPGGESVVEPAFHEIAGQISDQRFRRRTGQEEMSEIVRARLR